MSWLYERKRVFSRLNADIDMIRVFGRWSVYVNGYDQTTPYLRRMWQKALGQLPKNFKPKKILMLGLGAGGEIKTIEKKYPEAYLLALEHDPVMLEITKEVYKAGNFRKFPEIIIGPAEEMLSKLKGRFDLIILDLFNGKNPSPLLTDEQFVKMLKRKLDTKGWLLVNVYKFPEKLAELEQQFANWRSLFYKRSQVGFFRNRNLGLTGEALPEGLVLPWSFSKYLKSEALSSRIEAYEVGSSTFAEWKVGPIVFQQYYGDTEPNLINANAKIIFWQPFTKLQKPKGWLYAPLILNLGVEGFILLNENYSENWSRTAKTQRMQWLSQKDFQINNANFSDFSQAFRKSSVYATVKETPLRKLQNKIQHFPGQVDLFVIRNLKTGSLVAGLAVLNFPEHFFSLHLTAFVLPNQPHYLSTGLIHHWFEKSLEKQYKYLDFGQFTAPGYPKNWEGFSRFKSQFGTNFIRYPKVLVRINFKKRSKKIR